MGRNFFRVFLTLTLLVTLLQASYIQGFSQSDIALSIDAVDDSGYPLTSVALSVSDAQGFPIRGLTKDNFTLVQSGINIPIKSFTPLNQKPLTIALAIDTSRSTAYGTTPSLGSVIQSISEFVDSLASNDQIAVISFSDDVIVRQAPTSDKALVKDALNLLTSQGNASLNDAIVTAVETIKDQPGRRLLIFLTDGPDSGYSKYTFDQAMDDAARQSVIVYPFAWGGANQADLSKLADFTNGKVYSLTGDQPDLKAFQAAFNDVLLNLPELREQYNLQFESTLPADGVEYEFLVRLNYLGQEVEQVGRLTARQGSVTLSLPGLQEGQVVGGKVDFSPQISAPGSVTKLEITLDGQSLATVSTTPFEYLWDSTSVQPGLHKFVLTAQDSVGNADSIEINLSIQPPITINIISPTDQQTVSGSTSISTNVTAMAQISRVEFSVDDALLNTVDAPPYEFSWDLNGVPAGNHKISVSAFDINGYSSQSSINVIVAIQQKSGLIWIVGIVALVAAAVLIPLGLRSRKRMQKLGSSTPAASDDAAPSALTARLVEIDGINPDQSWPLSAENVRLGRKRDENDIQLKGLQASRKHAVISLKQGQYVIFSLNPENPVLINNQAVQQQVLNNGDVIQAGETTLRFEIPTNGA